MKNSQLIILNLYSTSKHLTKFKLSFKGRNRYNHWFMSPFESSSFRRLPDSQSSSLERDREHSTDLAVFCALLKNRFFDNSLDWYLLTLFLLRIQFVGSIGKRASWAIPRCAFPYTGKLWTLTHWNACSLFHVLRRYFGRYIQCEYPARKTLKCLTGRTLFT